MRAALRRLPIIIALCGAVLTAGPAQSDPGDVDPLFGARGTVTTPITVSYSSAEDVAVQPDGKIITGGWAFDQGAVCTLVRYLSDGTLDPGFGAGGVVVTKFGVVDPAPYCFAIQLQPDGKILVGGTAFALARYEPDGSLDTTFGDGGVARASLAPKAAIIQDLALQPDGKVVAAGFGYVYDSSDVPRFALARFNADGSLDTSFGNRGTVLSSFGGTRDEVNAVTVQPDGKIVAAGRSNGRYAVARYTATGSLDPTFGTGGRVTELERGNAYGLAIQPDGKVVVVGGISVSDPYITHAFALVRWKPDGSLDKDFGTDGVVKTIFADGSGASDVALQDDGMLVVGGWYGYGRDFALARYRPDGSLDSSFGTDGKLVTSIGPEYSGDAVKALALDGDRIIAAGWSMFFCDECNLYIRSAVARYRPDGSLDRSFGQDGTLNTEATGNDLAEAVAVDDDQGTLTVGSASTSEGTVFAVVRHDADGSVTGNFGAGGPVRTRFDGGGAVARAVTLQPDGKFIAGGERSGHGTHDLALARYQPDGQLDAGFGTEGKVVTPAATLDGADALALQHDLKIVVAGSSRTSKGMGFLVARYSRSGTLDPTFGSGGLVRTAFSGDAYGRAIGIQRDGKIVAAGSSRNHFALARYTPSGSLDPGFGSVGIVTEPAGEASSLAVQPNGRLVVAGTRNSRLVVARYLSSGSLDPTFGHDGEVSISIGSASSATSVGIQENGKIVAAGSSKQGSRRVIALARLREDGSLDPSFGKYGIAVRPLGLGDSSADGMALARTGDILVASSSIDIFDSDFAVTRFLGDSRYLRIRKGGTGQGETSSGPSGIECGSECLAKFADNTRVRLIASPSAGSVVDWGRGCRPKRRTCSLRLGASRTIRVRFFRCVVPKVKGKPLQRASEVIEAAHCSVGQVKRRLSPNVPKGRVIRQRPKPGAKRPASAKVRLVVSKGKRRHRGT